MRDYYRFRFSIVGSESANFFWVQSLIDGLGLLVLFVGIALGGPPKPVGGASLSDFIPLLVFVAALHLPTLMGEVAPRLACVAVMLVALAGVAAAIWIMLGWAEIPASSYPPKANRHQALLITVFLSACYAVVIACVARIKLRQVNKSLRTAADAGALG